MPVAMPEGELASVLVEFAQTMVTDFSIQEILDRLVLRIAEILPVTGAGVTLVTADMTPDYIAASNEAALTFERLQTELGQGPCRTSVESDRPVSVPDLAADAEYPLFAPAATSAGLGAAFAFPLRHGELRFGALDLYRDTPGALDEWDMATAQILADVASSYLTNAQNRLETAAQVDWFRDRSLHDSLTGLANRVLLHERLEHASKRAHRTQCLTAVVFADLNQFKQVNDSYGHAVGDELLIAVAKRLAALVREGDTVARVSGDEFVILCEDLAHEDDVRHLVTRMDQAFALPFSLGQREVTVGATIGVSYAGPGQAVSIEMVHSADAAMYRTKSVRRRTPDVAPVGALMQRPLRKSAHRTKPDGGNETAFIELREGAGGTVRDQATQHRANENELDQAKTDELTVIAAHSLLNSVAVITLGVATLKGRWQEIVASDREKILDGLCTHAYTIDDTLRALIQGRLRLNK